jgi:hypothetical protein
MGCVVRVFNLLGPVANHDSDVSNPASRGAQLHLHRMVCVYWQKALEARRWWVANDAHSLRSGLSLHNELRLIAIVLLHCISTSLASGGGAIGWIEISR